MVQLSCECPDQLLYITNIGIRPKSLQFFSRLFIDIDLSCFLDQHHGDVSTIFRHRKNVIILVCCERRFEFVQQLFQLILTRLLYFAISGVGSVLKVEISPAWKATRPCFKKGTLSGSSTLKRGAVRLQRKRGSRHTSLGNVSTHSQEDRHEPHDGILPQFGVPRQRSSRPEPCAQPRA